MRERRAEPIRILLVDDNAADIRLTVEAFKELEREIDVQVARDGAEALRRLRDEQAPRPDLVLLDLNMPRVSGRSVLEEIKQDPHLRRIPVCVLTTSNAPEDIAAAYDLHANCYLRKPVDMDSFVEAMRVLSAFWFDLVERP